MDTNQISCTDYTLGKIISHILGTSSTASRTVQPRLIVKRVGSRSGSGYMYQRVSCGDGEVVSAPSSTRGYSQRSRISAARRKCESPGAGDGQADRDWPHNLIALLHNPHKSMALVHGYAPLKKPQVDMRYQTWLTLVAGYRPRIRST